MQNHHRRWAPALLGLMALVLSSCQLMSGILSSNEGITPNPNPTPTPLGETRSLADIVIDDFIASIQANTFSRALDSAGKLSASDIATLKTTIRNKIASDGLGASKNIDKILPSVMEGISVGVKNLAAVDSDTVVSAQLLSKAMKSTSESLSKNASTLSAPSVVLSDVLKVVVKKGASDLAVIAATDPESAGKALQAAVKDVSTALKTNAVAISETVVLQTVVTASVQAAVESNHTGLVQAIFTGTAEATTNATTVGEVVKEAVLKARDGQVGKLMDADTATDLMKQASAGLTAKTLTVKVEVNTELLTKTTNALKDTGVTVSDTVVEAIKAVATEPDPEATLSATIDGVPYAETTELEYTTADRSITLSLPTATTITKQLIGPKGEDVTGNTYTLTGSGAFRFILLVKNTTGVKSAFKTLVIRVKALPSEPTPEAVASVTEGGTLVTGPLPWKKEGHTLKFDTKGTTANTSIKILSDSPAAFPVKDAEGVWSVVQKTGTVNYSVIVRNLGGTKTDVATVTVTVNPEPAVTAALEAFNGEVKVTAALPKKAFYDLTLKAEGSTPDGIYQIVATPSAQIIQTEKGVWSTKISTDTTFTLTVRADGGQNMATATKTVTIAPEAAPTVILAVKKDGVVVTSLPFSETGYDLVIDPAGSTLENTQLTLDDGGNNTVLVKNVDAGTWTAKAVQKTTTFTLTVKNLGGTKSATASAKITIAVPDTVPNQDVSTDVASGREYLRQHNWSAAKTAFAGALLKNPADQDAKIWSAFLDLVTLSVHPQLVDLLKTRVGVVDYPADMETLLSKTWLNASSYNTTAGFVKATSYNSNAYYFVRGKLTRGTEASGPWGSADGYYRSAGPNGSWTYLSGYGLDAYVFTPDASGDFMARYWSYNSVSSSADTWAKTHIADGTVYFESWQVLSGTSITPLPVLGTTPGFERLEYEGDNVATATHFGPTDYMRLLMANFVSRNPLGFTGVVEQVLTGPFGTGFDSILNRLTSVDDNFRTAVPANLLSQVTDALQTPAVPVEVSLGKPELLLLAAQLKATKSFVLYLGSVSFDYPMVQTFMDLISQPRGVDANGDREDDRLAAMYQSTPGLYSAGLFKERDASRRLASKSTFLSGLTDAKTALELYQTILKTKSNYYRTQLEKQITNVADVDGYLKTADQVLANLIFQNTTAAAAIDANTPLTVNSTLYNGTSTSGPLAFLTGDLPAGQTIVVNPGAVWANNILDPRFWLETDANGFSIYIKGENSSYWSNPPADWVKDNSFLVKLPADRSLLTAASYNLVSTASTGKYSRYVWAGPVFKVKLDALHAFYPAAQPNDQQLTFSFGPGWDLVESDWVSGTNGATYIYTLKPPVEVENYLAWVNKK